MAPASPLLAFDSVSSDLARVENTLREAVITDDEYLNEVASHLINAGGKRGRPTFAIGVAAAAHPTIESVPQEVIEGAVSVELVHLGSLYHDDVMDDASTRRTVESVNAKWGNLQAILAGDFLLAKASEIAASLGTEVAGLLARTIAKLCAGQVRELQHTYDVGRDEAAYLRSIEGKTASLYATACRIGALTAGLEPAWVEAFTDFGLRYGMAFQIIDDILDVTGTDEQLGKPAGHDLIEGVYTLPVLRTLAAGDEAGKELASMLGGPLTETDMGHARSIVRSSPHIESSMVTAREFIDSAIGVLEHTDGLAGREAVSAFEESTRHLLDTATGIVLACASS